MSVRLYERTCSCMCKHVCRHPCTQTCTRKSWIQEAPELRHHGVWKWGRTFSCHPPQHRSSFTYFPVPHYNCVSAPMCAYMKNYGCRVSRASLSSIPFFSSSPLLVFSYFDALAVLLFPFPSPFFFSYSALPSPTLPPPFSGIPRQPISLAVKITGESATLDVTFQLIFFLPLLQEFLSLSIKLEECLSEGPVQET